MDYFRIVGIVSALLLFGCATVKPCDQPGETVPTQSAAPAISSFAMDALQSQNAKRAKIYISADGTIRKVAIYVEKEGIPDWVHEMADTKLGKGEDLSYEIEQYVDGPQAYEVTRKVKGVSTELSVAVDKTLLYIEKELKKSELPEPVAELLKGLEDFKLEKAESKTNAEGEIEYELVGKQAGRDVQVKVSSEGKQIGRSHVIPAKVAADE